MRQGFRFLFDRSYLDTGRLAGVNLLVEARGFPARDERVFRCHEFPFFTAAYRKRKQIRRARHPEEEFPLNRATVLP